MKAQSRYKKQVFCVRCRSATFTNAWLSIVYRLRWLRLVWLVHRVSGSACCAHNVPIDLINCSKRMGWRGLVFVEM
ncbi:hypothetical protein BDR22DRAFT_873986 [Usnea florida]